MTGNRTHSGAVAAIVALFASVDLLVHGEALRKTEFLYRKKMVKLKLSKT